MFGVLEIILRRDPIPGQSFGLGQIQIALIVSLGVLRTPRLGAGEPGRFSSPGLGCSRHCVGHAFAISAQLCRRWMTLRSVVHIGPYAARRKPRDVDWRIVGLPHNQRVRCRKGDDRTAMGVRRKLGAALDQNRELAERIRADEAYIGSQSGVFKLPDGGAVASGSAGYSGNGRFIDCTAPEFSPPFRLQPASYRSCRWQR
jgi:hypothetical protein